jgi:hypothetical protein
MAALRTLSHCHRIVPRAYLAERLHNYGMPTPSRKPPQPDPAVMVHGILQATTDDARNMYRLAGTPKGWPARGDSQPASFLPTN